MKTQLSIAQCATLACLWEATIPKPGNVHRGADFEDLSFGDFLVSAVAIGPAIERAAEIGVGGAVYEAVSQMRQLVGTNTSLGTILLLAPLAAVQPDIPLVMSTVGLVLHSLTPRDAQLVYEGIRHSLPGGLGRIDSMDVQDSPPPDLLAAMRLAADRDLIARQYANFFEQLFCNVVPWMREELSAGRALGPVVRHVHVRMMHEFPDSLIARKCGQQVAIAAAGRAGVVLKAGQPGDEAYEYAMADLDFWLRSDRRRNPGTTADMIAAGLFVLLRDDRDDIMKFPMKLEYPV